MTQAPLSRSQPDPVEPARELGTQGPAGRETVTEFGVSVGAGIMIAKRQRRSVRRKPKNATTDSQNYLGIYCSILSIESLKDCIASVSQNIDKYIFAYIALFTAEISETVSRYVTSQKSLYSSRITFAKRPNYFATTTHKVIPAISPSSHHIPPPSGLFSSRDLRAVWLG